MYRDAKNAVYIVGQTPNRNFQVTYKNMFLESKKKFSGLFLKITNTPSKPLKGIIEVVGLTTVEFEKVPVANQKPKVSKGQLVSGGIPGRNFNYGGVLYIIGGTPGTQYNIRYRSQPKIRTVKSNSQGIIKINSSKAWPHTGGTVLVIGTQEIPISSLPLAGKEILDAA